MRHKSPAFERARNRATSAHLKALRNISLSVTVSTRALKVASFISLSGLDHHEGMRPQRIGTSARAPLRPITVSIVVAGQML